MDLVELALNPRKAMQRMSPFTNELPPGQVRRLEYFFGDRAAADSAERAVYSKDASQPPSTLKMLLKRDAWAVVRPQVRGELLELIQFAVQNGVPIVPRGAGTSGYGGSVPTEGGVVVDMRAFRKIINIDAANKLVRVEANATFFQLDKALAEHGLTLRQYPTSYHAATLAGWLAQGGGGVGSLKYGPFRNDVAEVTILAPDGSLHVLTGDAIDIASETFGTAGFILEVVLKVREKTQHAHFLATFDDLNKMTLAARRIQLESKAYNLITFTPEYAELVNAAAGAKILPVKYGLLATLERDDEALGTEVVKGAILTSGGTAAKDADAQKAWDNRFNHLNLKRLGPSVVVGESVIHVEKLRDAIDAAWSAQRMNRACIWTIAISPTEQDVIFYGLDDERRGTYPLAMGNALAVIDAVKGVGGRSYSTGVLASNESKRVLGRERLKALKAWRKEMDPKEVFNPGPVFGPRTRLNPLPVHDFSLQMNVAGPLLKAQRGIFRYPGGDKADPQFAAQQRALGRVHAGLLGELSTEVTSCIFCGMCNAYAPEGDATPWETAQPRGRVILAKAVIDGDATISPRAHRNVAWTALEHMPDAVCPVKIPIQRVTDLLLAAAVTQHGPLPEQAELVASYAEHGNAYGKAADERAKWVKIGFDPVANVAFVADDVAAFESQDVAQNAALVLANAGFPTTHMGKADAGSGAVMFETGNRAAATEKVAAFLEALAKRAITTVVTPDANGFRAMTLEWPMVARDNDVAAPTPLHTSSVLADLIKGKKIEFATKLDKKAVLHVPEGLPPAQRDAVRAVATALCANLVEAPHQECGHGRALNKLDAALHQRMAENALRAALDAGAEVVLTMSPGCQVTLKTAAKKAKAGLEVLDLHTLVAQHMKVPEGGAVAAPVAAPAEEEKPKEPVIGPDQYRVEFVKEGVVLAVGKNQTILEAGEEQGIELPSSCRAGSCDTCSARWEGTAADQSAGAALSPDQQKTYVLTCIARPKGPIKIWSDERP